MANSIIIRSEKSNEEINKGVGGMVRNVMVTTVIMCLASFLVMFGKLIMVNITGERFYLDDVISPVTMTIGMLLLIAGIAYAVCSILAISKKTKQYKAYLDVETVTVCEENVYGSTASGEFALKYDQIDSVRVYPNNKDKNKKGLVLLVLNNLEIRDKSGKIYTFYTIKNTGEIKSAIEHQKNNI